jgi:predicted transposase/invertase (TIGR01784 family)
MERYNPLNDYLFQKIMGEKGDEEQPLAFLNAVLKPKPKNTLKSVEILENKTITADVLDDRTIILDVRAVTSAGERVNIEVQLKDLHNMGKRTLFYWSREFMKGIEKGDTFDILPKVITINIVNFDYIALEEYHTCFHLREDKHRAYVLTDVIEVHFINMVKFRRQETKDIVNNSLERWLTFFDQNTPEEVLEEVIKMDSAIQKTVRKMDIVTSGEDFQHQYTLRMMALSDKTTEINTAVEKQDIKTKTEIAQNLISLDIPLEKIIKATGLDIGTVKKLKKQG